MNFSCVIFKLLLVLFFLIGENLRPLIGEEKELNYGGEKNAKQAVDFKRTNSDFMLPLIITVCC